ncbi:putative Calpain-B [Glarea lozoyensis 74030]|uniref:Putative Calpain-B n=1 Tax=Glarea lozoyensis (strain ATCC 74030 / MF5533) TaxID=1104152 RepID=H0ELZ3_GLAL7|nr:putative Calpain-B [Glarea lozoyensis 74030]
MENGIQRLCVEYDTKVGIYGFVFFRDGEWIVSIIDDKLYLKSPDWDSLSAERTLLERSEVDDIEAEYRKTYQTGSQALAFARCLDKNETWLPLLEKAYAKSHGDYGSLKGGWSGEGSEDLTGGVTTEFLSSDILDIDDFWTNELMKVNKEFLFGCSTGLFDGGYGSRDGITEGHAYVIMDARELSTGERLLKLRNPWGKGNTGNWHGAWSDGSKELTVDAQKELDHKFGNDSVFWISYPDFLRKYQHFDRTRLFMDSPDWRLSQKWVSVEVPWKSEFKQMFHIVLKKDSPVVIVLNELDERYFAGLEGQYDFRLQFRLHDVNTLDEEDFIVRSHGNYLMLRSVATELISLSAGTYSVSVMIVAERMKSQFTVEEIIKEQCENKGDNDKLAQVGASYDLAHSKVTAHLENQASAQLAQAKADARALRDSARKRIWEKRHLLRKMSKKQAKKNKKKQWKKSNEIREAYNAKMDAEPKDVGVQTENTEELQEIKMEDKSSQTMAPEELTAEVDKLAEFVPQEISDQPEIAVSDSSKDSPNTPEPTKGTPAVTTTETTSATTTKTASATLMTNEQNCTQHVNYAATPEYSDDASEGASSASPVSEIEDLYSDDEAAYAALFPKPANEKPGTDPKSKPADDDDDIEPWNAVCVVGFRVYSKDEQLEIRLWEPDFNGIKKEPVGEEFQGDDEGCEGDDEDESEICGKNASKGQKSKQPTTDTKTQSSTVEVKTEVTVVETKTRELMINTKIQDPIVDMEAQAPAIDAKNQEPTADTNASEAANGTKTEELTSETKVAETAAGTETQESAVDTKTQEPSTDTKTGEAEADKKSQESTVDTKKQEPTTDTKTEDPTTDTSTPESTVDKATPVTEDDKKTGDAATETKTKVIAFPDNAETPPEEDTVAQTSNEVTEPPKDEDELSKEDSQSDSAERRDSTESPTDFVVVAAEVDPSDSCRCSSVFDLCINHDSQSILELRPRLQTGFTPISFAGFNNLPPPSPTPLTLLPFQ